MPKFDAILPALDRLRRRLPGQGFVGSQSVGMSNQLDGRVYFIEYEKYRVVLGILGMNRPKPSSFRGVFPKPSPEFEPLTATGLDTRMELEWDPLLYGLEDELREFLRPHASQTVYPPRRAEPESRLTLPDEYYPALSAALRQRLQGWNPGLLHLDPRISSPRWACHNWSTWREWCPQIEPDIEARGFAGCFQLEPSRLALPWPVEVGAIEMDALEFYRAYPEAHGRLHLGPPVFSEDGTQCALLMSNSLGIRTLDFERPPRLPKELGSEATQFTEFILLERRPEGWALTGHLPDEVSSPPALLEASEMRRLQAELGDWGRVVKVQVNWKTAIEASLETPGGARRVVCGPALSQQMAELELESRIFREHTIWVFSERLSGDAIKQAVALQ